MFAIRVNNVFLDISENFSIPFYLFNTAFSSSNSYTLDFDLPATDKNKQALGFPNDPYFIIKNHKISCQICRYDEIIFEGILTIEACPEKGISAFMSFANGNFYEKTANVNMQDDIWGSDINTGNNTDDVVDYATDLLSKNIDDTDLNGFPVACNFPLVYAPEFYGDSNEGFFGYLNWFEFGLDQEIAKNYINESEPTNDNRFAIVPFFYLIWIFKKINEYLNLNATGSFFTDVNLKRVLLLNNFDLARKEKKYFTRCSNVDGFDLNETTGSIHVPIVFNDFTTNPNEDVNNCFYNHTLGTIYYPQTKGVHRFVFKGRVQSDIVNHWGVAIAVKNVNTGYTLHYVLYDTDDSFIDIEFEWSTFVVNLTDQFSITTWIVPYPLPATFTITFKPNYYAIFSPDSYLNLNRYNNIISPKNHMPDISINDFITNICAYLGYIPFVNDYANEIHICKFSDMYNDEEIIDISNKITDNYTVSAINRNRLKFTSTYETKGHSIYTYLGEYANYLLLPPPSAGNLLAFVTALNAYYFSYFDDTEFILKWKRFDFEYSPIELGLDVDDLIEIAPDVKPAMIHWHDKDQENIICPETTMQGTSPIFDTGINSFDLELIQYLGMLPGPYSGLNYPCASPMRYDKNGNAITTMDLSPEWIAENNYKEHFAKLIQTNRTLDIPANFSYSDIKNLKLYKKYRIEKMVGFIVSVEGEFGYDKPNNATLKFLPL